MTWNLRNFVVFIIDLFIGAVGILLGLRIVLKLVAANSATPFVSWLYGISDNLVAPFAGILPSINMGSGAVLDTVALISLVAYTIMAYLVTWLIDSLIAHMPVRYTRHSEHVHVH